MQKYPITSSSTIKVIGTTTERKLTIGRVSSRERKTTRFDFKAERRTKQEARLKQKE